MYLGGPGASQWVSLKSFVKSINGNDGVSEGALGARKCATGEKHVAGGGGAGGGAG